MPSWASTRSGARGSRSSCTSTWVQTPRSLSTVLGVEREVGEVLVEDARAHVAEHVLLDDLAHLHLHLLQPPRLGGGGEQQHQHPEHAADGRAAPARAARASPRARAAPGARGPRPAGRARGGWRAGSPPAATSPGGAGSGGGRAGRSPRASPPSRAAPRSPGGTASRRAAGRGTPPRAGAGPAARSGDSGRGWRARATSRARSEPPGADVSPDLHPLEARCGSPRRRRWPAPRPGSARGRRR